METDQTPSSNEARSEGIIIAEELLHKCHQLLSELEQFRIFLTEQKKDHIVDIRQFYNSVRSELKSLEKVPISQLKIYQNSIDYL